MNIVYNELWNDKWIPRVSIITPVFNRRKELVRAINSIELQTYRNIEHIIINDGSIEFLDDIVAEYMVRVDFPIAYIKKNNGGVHTARNAGISISRGEMMAFLDSDDEFTSNFVQAFLDAWDSIPEDCRIEYRECNAFCTDQNGMRIGKQLPQNINILPYEKAKKIAKKGKTGEKVGFFRGDLMRANPWPEPDGVKVVSESIIWATLSHKYKTWFLNDELRIYHMEQPDSITRSTRTEQGVINSLYNSLWFINNRTQYGIGLKEYCINNLKYSTFRHILNWKYGYPNYDWAQKGVRTVSGILCQIVLWIPSMFIAMFFCCRNRDL